MEKKLGVDLQMEPSEGGLKELVLRWFTETQAPLILNNGNFPDWFRGFAARKDAEDLLRDKALGCFLVRLSDKAIGYILSYKGLDRCRHFVITQNQNGHFVISGDCQTYCSLTELIEHYKVSPIQPFGEYLTYSCYEESTGELYDVVSYNPKETSGVNVQALRILWDQKHQHHSDHRTQQQSERATVRPAVPPKSKSRKLTGTMSVYAVSLSQGVPPVPKRGVPLGVSLSGFLPDTTSHPKETKSNSNRSELLRGHTTPGLMTRRDSFNATDTQSAGDLSPSGTTYSELTLVESKSKSLQSLPQLHNDSMEVEEEGEEEQEEEKQEVEELEEEDEEEEEEYSNQLNSPSLTQPASYPPSPLKRVTCHTYSLHEPSTSRQEQSSDDQELLRPNPLYQTSEEPGGSSAPQGDGMYAEVPERPTPAGLPDDTYERIPGEVIAAAIQANTYESLDDMKTKKSKSTWGKNNMKWKKFLPEYMKK